jgi:hypothetical protein
MDLLWPAIDVAAVLVLIGLFWWAKDNFADTEIRIAIALIAIGIGLFAHFHKTSDLWKSLGMTFMWEYGVVGSFFALLFTVVGIGKLVQRLSGKNNSAGKETHEKE